jgi:hypothetical protein
MHKAALNHSTISRQNFDPPTAPNVPITCVQVSGSEPYLVCVPLDRVADVAVGTLPVAGRFLARACIVITGETATVDIIGLRVSVHRLHGLCAWVCKNKLRYACMCKKHVVC